MSQMCYFNTSEDIKVQGSRYLFALNHSKMKKLQPYRVKTRFKQHKNFPTDHSLFIPCYNLQHVKTSGYLCALKTIDKWRLAVIQGVDIKSDGRHIVYFLLFKDGCTWDVIFRNHEEYQLRPKINLITKYCEIGTQKLQSEDFVPLVEVSRYFNGGVAKHMHISERDGCFEQPKEGPDYWWEARGNIFKGLFNQEHPTRTFELKARTDMTFCKPTELLLLDHRPTKKARTQDKDGECHDHNSKDDLIQLAAKKMLDWKVLDRRGKKDPVPIYYVRENKNKEDPGKEKYYLVPFKEVSCQDNVVTFGKVRISQKDKLVQEVSGLSPEKYDEKLLSLCGNQCVDLFIVDPRKHCRGFVFSILGSKENIPEEAKKIFSSSTVTIFKEDRQEMFTDSSLCHGTVVFRGMPWYFETGILEKDLLALDFMHGNKDSGMANSRHGVHMHNFFSYTGPRASSQSTSSPVEATTCGHDLYTKEYCPLTYPAGVKLGRVLCKQSDQMMDNSGNAMMKMAIMFQNMKNEEGEGKGGGYEMICFNRIVTVWFASVSVIVSNSLFEIEPSELKTVLLKSMHKDKNDKVDPNFGEAIKNAIICGTLRNEDEKTLLQYLQRYKDSVGDQVGMNTVCCWTTVKSDNCVEEEKMPSFEHYFCCENMGFGLDISSNVLNHKDVGGSFGACFLSPFLVHGTSICLSISSDQKLFLSILKKGWIPFAWGRSGAGPKPGS